MEKLLFILCAALFVASCGDKGDDNGKKFNPETDWATIVVNAQTDFADLPDLTWELTMNEPTDDNDIPPFLRNLMVKGDVEELRHVHYVPDPILVMFDYYDEIYNIDFSQTKLVEVLYQEFPKKARTVVLPETLKTLNAGFSGCEELTEMVIPNSVESLHDYNFEKLTKLKSIVVKAATPPDVLYTMDLSPEQEAQYPKIYPADSWKLTVPVGAKAVYEAHEWWGRFANIVEK